MRRLAAIAVLLLAMLGLGAGLATPAAHAATAQPGHAMAWGGSAAGNRALDYAEAHYTGDWYVYGAAGPSAFDCSGLVMAAFGHGAGVWLPRTTFSMLGSWHLHRVYSPQRGDLLFFGSGHVEIATAWYHTSFGAQHSGTQVGWHQWNGWWAPTMFFRVY